MKPLEPVTEPRARNEANPGGLNSGKWDKFPIAGIYATAAGDDLAREEPWILNPYEDDPNDHLAYDLNTGLVGGKTERGQETVEILGLNRDGLIEARIRT